MEVANNVVIESFKPKKFILFVPVLLVSLLIGGQSIFAETPPKKALPLSPSLLYAKHDPTNAPKGPKEVDWLEMIRTKIPPLSHERGDRWPLVLFTSVGSHTLAKKDIQMLLARGIAQHLPLKISSIPAASALQKAGSPVILTAGDISAWPYTLEKDKKKWAHQYPKNMKVSPQWRNLPSPARFSGWAIAGNKLRTLLKRFKKENITVDAVWLDYEGEPSQADYYATLLSPTSRALLPAKAMKDKASFRLYSRQLWAQLLSTYMAGPAREIFPKISITNWIMTLSSPERPVLGWTNLPHPPMGPTLFTATNPVAYGIDTAFLALWKTSYRLDQEHVDQFYMHLLLRQVSADSENRQRMAPYMASIPWVGRWVPDHPDKRVPIMSRERYREGLRHLWLRGIDGMQVFNPTRTTEALEMALFEVEDAAAIYNEMLAYRPFLEKGTVLNFQYPKIQESGPLWSGLRLRNEAIIRVFWQGSKIGKLTIKPWEDLSIALNNPMQGMTFHLRRDPKTNRVKVLYTGR